MQILYNDEFLLAHISFLHHRLHALSRNTTRNERIIAYTSQPQVSLAIETV